MERKYYIGGSEKSAVTLSERQIRRQIEKYGIPKDLYVDNPIKTSRDYSLEQWKNLHHFQVRLPEEFGLC